MFSEISIMLIFDEVTHAGAALEIEANGVYSVDPQTQQLVHHRPDSYQAEEALMGISVDYNHKQYGASDGEFEAWWFEQDPNERYGWPLNSKPKFSKTTELDWLELPARFPDRSRHCPYNLFSIGRLLMTGRATPATIGTAIERQGIYVTNAIGQLKFTDYDLSCMEVTQALADYVRYGFRKTWYEPKALNNMVYWTSGWPQEALPDFNAIAAEPFPQPNSSAAPATTVSAGTVPAAEVHEHFSGGSKGENANLAIIGGLLAILNGQLNCRAHPSFQSQNQIIEKLTKDLEGLSGTRERNLKDKFSKANRLIQDFFAQKGDPSAR